LQVYDGQPFALLRLEAGMKSIRLRTCIVIFAIATFALSLAIAKDSDDEQRLQKAAQVLGEVINIPDNIPQDLIDKSECVIVLPSVKKFAIGFGASWGKGAMVCRGGEKFDGKWGTPAAFALKAGNLGFQLGGEATDFVLLVMNPKGVNALLSDEVKLGGAISAAAGPKGRDATAETDAQMKAEVLSYSRSKGLFAGISLEGSTLRQDKDANKNLYGHDITAKEIVLENKVQPTAGGQAIDDVLNKKSPKNVSGK
jgi:lipid-binding SYLF domain-containing protein